MSEHSSQEAFPARVRRPRNPRPNDTSSEEFWKNNPYFNGVDDEDEDDDSQDFQPVQESNLSEEGSNDDFVDSLENWEDVIEPEHPNLDPPLKQSNNLLRQNLASYSTMRGLHSLVDISTLERIEATSYVKYLENQTYRPSDVLNRTYKSVPYTGSDTHDHDEQEFTKTEYHSQLFKLEDGRYYLDLEILQLRRLLKLMEKEKFNQYAAFRKLQQDSNTDVEAIIKRQIHQLQLQKHNLQVNRDLEGALFNLAIDQSFYMKLKKVFARTTPKYIQELSNLKAKNVLSQPQDVWYLKDFKVFQEKYNTLLPPYQYYEFTNEEALGITYNLIQTALAEGSNTQSKRWLLTVFQDMMFGLLEMASGTEKPSLKLQNHLIIEAVSAKKNQALSRAAPAGEPVTVLQDDPGDQTTKTKFFPNFKKFDQCLYTRPVVEYSFEIFHQLYQRIAALTSLNEQIQIQADSYPLSQLFIELVYRLLLDQINEANFMLLLKTVFIEEDALFLAPIVAQIVQWRRVFCEYDQISQELIIAWIGRNLGEDSKQSIPEVKERMKVDAELLLRKIREEIPNTRLCRFQTVQRRIFIHQFELQNLYDA